MKDKQHIEILNKINDISAAIKKTIGISSMYCGWFVQDSPKSHKDLTEVEKRIGMSIPSDLRGFLMSYGCFYNHFDGDGMMVGYFNRPTFPKVCGGMVQVLDTSGWGDYRVETDFPENSVIYLNRNYLIFGHFMVSEDVYDYFYFDESGNFGILVFDQNFSDHEAWEHLLELSEGVNRHKMTFSELLDPYLRKTLESTEEAYRLYTQNN